METKFCSVVPNICGYSVCTYDLYTSPYIVRVIKSRRIRWARHVTRMEERRGIYRVLVGKSEGK